MKNVLFLFFISTISYGQINNIQQLDEVIIYGHFSKELNSGYQISTLKDSINIPKNLNDILQEKENLYFKQYGNGMVSSISFRGSGAQHTAVYYNGIPINSSLNGQTDFNTIPANNYSQIHIRKGGGSSVLGSGAIGGAINLQDNIQFKNKNKTNLTLGFGSYETYKINALNEFSTAKFYTKTGISVNASKNDYPFLDNNLKNENGEFKNYHIKTVFGYKLNNSNQISVNFNFNNNNRNLSRTLTAPSNSKLIGENYRLLTSWKHKKINYNSKMTLAVLHENYNYFFNKNLKDYSYGKAIDYILKYDFNHFFKPKYSLHSGIYNKFSEASGSDLLTKNSNLFEVFSLFQYKLNSNIKTNISVRKGFASNYKIPLIYAFDTRIRLSDKVQIKLNHSTNYRLPTFNDLYWNPGGNPKLKSEFSTNFEINFNLKLKNFNADISSFFTKNKDLIQWKPITNTFWQPFNIQNVETFGNEFQLNYKIHRISLNTKISYTVSKDTDLNKQLIYIPNLLNTNVVTYKYKTYKMELIQKYTGKAFTTSSNTNTISDYFLYHLKIHKNFKKYNIGFALNNILNKKYQIIAFRPMPNRNFEIYLNYQF